MTAPGTFLNWLQRALLALGFGVCHQLPDRSFISGGFQQPVCARCSGMYVGVVFGLLALLFMYRYRRPPAAHADERLQAQLHWSYWIWLALAFTAMACDGISSYAGLRPTTDTIRLITGLAVGGALAPLLLALLNMTLLAPRASVRMLSRPREWAVLLGVLALAGVIDYPLGQVLGPVVPTLVGLCLLATYMTVALVVIGLVKRFEHRVNRVADAAAPALIALVSAFVLLMLFALGKSALLTMLLS